jgi:hypothetical protein
MSAPQSYVDISRTCMNSFKCLRQNKNFLHRTPTLIFVLSEIWNKYRTTSAFVGDLLGKSIKRMVGIKIEIAQGF